MFTGSPVWYLLYLFFFQKEFNISALSVSEPIVARSGFCRDPEAGSFEMCSVFKHVSTRSTSPRTSGYQCALVSPFGLGPVVLVLTDWFMALFRGGGGGGGGGGAAAKFVWAGAGGTRANDNCWGRADVSATVSAIAEQTAATEPMVLAQACFESANQERVLWNSRLVIVLRLGRLAPSHDTPKVVTKKIFFFF